MTFGWICLTSIGISYFFDLKNGLRLYKDLADLGYKVDNKRLKDITNVLNPNGGIIDNLKLCTPFYNLYYVLQKVKLYNDQKGIVADQIRALGALEEMTDFEKKEYNKKPTGFRALFTPLICQSKLIGASNEVMNYDGVDCKIDYKYNKKGDVVIINIDGPLGRLPIKEQAKIYNEYRQKKFDETVETASKLLQSEEVKLIESKPEEELTEAEKEKKLYIVKIRKLVEFVEEAKKCKEGKEYKKITLNLDEMKRK